jgi:hypothetical protein
MPQGMVLVRADAPGEATDEALAAAMHGIGRLAAHDGGPEPDDGAARSTFLRSTRHSGIEPPGISGRSSGNMSMNRSAIFALLPTLLLAGGASAVEVYKWVDGKGKVHYGDRPEGTRSKKIEVKVDSPSPDATATARDERTRKLLEQYEIEREELAEGRAKKAELEAERQQNCAMAKDILEDYRTASYLYDKDKSGERVVLTKEQRAAAEDEARKAVDKWCTPAS